MDENKQLNAAERVTTETAELQEIVKEWQKARRREHWMLTLWFCLAAAAAVFLAFTILPNEAAIGTLTGAIPLPLILLFVTAYRDSAAWKKLQQEHPALQQAESFKSNLGCVVLLMGAMLIGAFLFYALFDFVASGKVTSANNGARVVYNAVTTWQAESEIYDKDIPLKTGIYYISEEMTPDEDSVAYNIYRYFHSGDYWCAIVCDDEGKILYTFYSDEEITEDELTPMEREQQCDIEANLFTRGEVVGWYAPQEE